MPKYSNDGTGRDMYLCTHLTKIPSTGKSKFSERPPSQQSKAQHVRTDPLPPYQPSGTGRDTFHRIEASGPQSAWNLRSYEPASESVGFFGGVGEVPRKLVSAGGELGGAKHSKAQRGLMTRLASPKAHGDPTNPAGLIVPGSFLRK